MNHKRLLEEMKKDSMSLGILFVLLLISFKIVFYKESFVVIVRSVAGFFWVFLIPGFLSLYYWRNIFNFLARAIFGAVLGLGLVSILSYYLSLVGLHVSMHYIYVPLLIDLIGLCMIFYLGRNKKE